MNEEDDEQSLLGRFSARPVPTEIRERILRQARLKAAEQQLLTPGLRRAAMVLVTAGVLSFLVVWPLARKQQRALETELNWTPEAGFSSGQEIDKEISQLMAEFPDLEAIPKTWLKWNLACGQGDKASAAISLNDIQEKIHEH